MSPLLTTPEERHFSMESLLSDRSPADLAEGFLDLNSPLLREALPAEDDAIPGSGPSVLDARDREALFGRFLPWLQRLMRRYRMSPEAREDAYGELYCRFCTLLEQYEPQRGVPFEPYLYRQLGAFLYTHARSGWRRSRRELPFLAEDGAESLGCLAGDPTPEWDDRLMTTHVRRLLPTAMREIPMRQKRVVALRYLHELSYEEIADRLQIQPATARSLARHGLHSLREWMRKRRVAWD